VFPNHRISEVVGASLAISGKNLRLAADAIHRRYLYPGAHFTALRSALIGASYEN
jgi:vancomycin resistance protein YoaR